jgi:hypothetical protein
MLVGGGLDNRPLGTGQNAVDVAEESNAVVELVPQAVRGKPVGA